MSVTEKLKETLSKAAGALSFRVSEVLLERSPDPAHGDFATPIALSLAKQAKRKPLEVAEEIVRYILRNKPEGVERVEVAGAGFINFFLSPSFFKQTVQKVVDAPEEWGKNERLSGKKVMVEYTDPNPFKEFHIGHLMSNAIGESISRLIEFSGADVKRANYQGDVGLHVAKALWGYRKLGGEVTSVKELGRAYVLGAAAYEEDSEAKQEIQDINRKVYNRSDAKLNDQYLAGRHLSLDYFETIYKRLGTKFDFYFFESESGAFGKSVVEEGLKNGIFERSEGAVVFRGEKYGLHTRVFLTKDGLPTYEAKELGLAKGKYGKYQYDFSVVVTGNEIVEYFKVLLKAMEEIFPELAAKTRHISHGMLRLPSGKMSSRKGEVISAETLLDDMKEAALSRMENSDVVDKESVADMVSVAAVKYSILKQSIGKDIIFDMQKSLSLEGDSGPYLQYAHTRALSVLRKAKEEGIAEDIAAPSGVVTSVEKLLIHFPDVVERAAREYEPHYVVTYLTELASAFNSYYAQERIVTTEPDAPYKVALTKAFAATMKNGLRLLGIKAPERM